VIDRLASQGKNDEIIFRCATLPKSHDFSFSGIKTAVYNFRQSHSVRQKIPVKKIAYSFQESVVGALTKKSIEACLVKKIKTLIIGGGVAANSRLREKLNTEGKKHGIRVFFPELSLCMDNAAMVAGLGFHHDNAKQKNKRSVS
jgi:N6-L-threonylcarbamoyladenine synthase